MNYKSVVSTFFSAAAVKRLAVTVVFLLCGTGVWADPPAGKGKGKVPPGHANDRSQEAPARSSKPNPDDRLTRDLVTAGITAVAASLLVDDLGISRSGYQTLPPGVRKNLARGKSLPPGIAKKSLPGDFVKRLPVHPGYEWISVGTDLLLVGVGSRIIADVLLDVFK